MRVPAELDAVLAAEDLTDYECEEFIEGIQYQIDGIVSRGVLRTVRTWRCTATCHDFSIGLPFGSEYLTQAVRASRESNSPRTTADVPPTAHQFINSTS